MDPPHQLPPTTDSRSPFPHARHTHRSTTQHLLFPAAMGSIPPPSSPPTPPADVIFRSKLPDLEIPTHVPLHSYVFERLPDFRDRPFLVSAATGAAVTYGAAHSSVSRLAAGLHRLGVRRRDVIMLLLPNSPELVMSFLAASFLGATSTAANPLLTAAEVRRHAAASAARIVITESALAHKFGGEVAVVCVDDGAFEELMSADESELEEVGIEDDDVVALPFSSGTTGMPKGVMLTHRGLVTSVVQQVEGENPSLYWREDDVILCFLPLFHIYSMSVMLNALRVGATILIMKKFEATTMLELVEKYRVTVTPLVPPVVVELAKIPTIDDYNLSSVRMVMVGAAPMGKELEDTLRAKFPNAKLGQGYGMTEAGSVLSICLAFAKDPFEVKSGSVGTVIRNAEVKIIDLESGASLSHNQAGEICIRGPQIMKGYLNDPKATEETIDKDGWLHTGDVGYVDDGDELFLVDRLKELIKYKGFQVAPAELEAMLITHPNITSAAVVSMKDELAGELPVAFVVLSDNSGTTEDEIKSFISKQVVFYKRIHRVFFIEAIPKSPSGKILRKELRGMLADGFPNGRIPN